MRRIILRFVIYFPIIICAGIICFIGCSKPNDDTYLSVKLPDKFVGAFLGVDPLGTNQLNYVKNSVDSAIDYKIDVICLIVNWNSVQPTKSTINSDALSAMVEAIKSKGCKCILRIYANAGSSFRAWPSWLNISDQYASSNTINNPLPWDAAYQSEFYSFTKALSDAFKSKNKTFPDALQFTLGGDYGEQVLASYTSPDPYNTYLDKLYSVEEEHITTQTTDWGTTICDYITMVNSLSPNQIAVDSRVGNFGINHGARFIQCNAGSYELQNASYGQNNITLLKSFSGSYKILLEDTDIDRSVQTRLDILKQIETANNIAFDGVIIDIDDLTSSNTSGIANLRSHLGLK